MNATMLARPRTGALLLALACGAAAVVPAPADANGTRSAAGRTALISCEHVATFRPSSYVLACGDGNASLERLRWSAWTKARAAARGVYHVNDCVPYCAAGHFHDYPATVVFDRPVSSSFGTAFNRVVVKFGPGGRTIVRDGLVPTM